MSRKDENHCWRCGKRYGSPLYTETGPIRIQVGECLPYDWGSVLCSDCEDLEVEEKALREYPEEFKEINLEGVGQK